MSMNQQLLYQSFLELLVATYSPPQGSNLKQTTKQLLALLQKLLTSQLLYKFVYNTIINQTLAQTLRKAACNCLARAFELQIKIPNTAQVFEGLLQLIRNENLQENIATIIIQSSIKSLINLHIKGENTGDSQVSNHILQMLYSEVQRKQQKSHKTILRLCQLSLVVLQLFEAQQLFYFLRDNNHLTLLSKNSNMYSQQILSHFLILNQQSVQSLNSYSFSQQKLFVSVLSSFVSIFNGLLLQVYDIDDYHSDVVTTLNQTSQYCQFIVSLMELNLKSGQQIICTANYPITVHLNKMKGQMMVLAEMTFQSCPQIFKICFNTFLSFNNQTNKDRSKQDILSNVMVLLQRMCLDKKYQSYVTSQRGTIIFVLVNYCVANIEEYEQLINEPSQFVQLQNQFCQEQDQPLLKVKAISFLSSLCLTIDGALSIIIQICLMFIDDILKTELENHDRYKQMLQTYEKFPFSKQNNIAKLQTTLLILAALMDQIEKRQQLKNVTSSMISYRFQQLITHPQDIIKCRIIQLTGYLPDKRFIQAYIQLFKSNPSEVIREQIINTYRKLISRGMPNQELKFYVAESGFRLLNYLSSCSTLFEQIILNNPDFVNDDQKITMIIQKLSRDICAQFTNPQRQIVSNVNRLVNTLNAFLDKVTRIKSFQKLFIPVLQTVMGNKNTQQSIIQLACRLVNRMREITPIQEEFVQMFEPLITKNNMVLNNLVELMNLHLVYKSKKSDKIIMMVIKCLEVSVQSHNNQDIVEILMLFENYILQASALEDIIKTIFTGLIKMLGVPFPELVKSRIVETIISGFYNHSKLTYSLLSQIQIYSQIVSSLIHSPQDHLFTPRIRKAHVIYSMAIAELESSRQNSGCTQIIESVLLLLQKFEKNPDPKKQRQLQQQYQNAIYQSNDRLKTVIFMKDKNYFHGLDAVDEFIYFKDKIDNIIRNGGAQLLCNLDKQKIGKYYQKQLVGKELRNIVRVKRTQ